MRKHPWKVRAGEGVVVALMCACVFLILCSFYAMKTSREGLILAHGSHGLTGQELKAYASAGMAVLLIAVVPGYSALASRMPRIRLIDTSYIIVIASLAGFYVLDRVGVSIGVALFIWIGLVNMLLVAQFWSFASDLYTEEQGRRLFAVIGLGASAGGVVGPRIAAYATSEGLLLAAAALLVPCIGLFHAIDRIERRHLHGDALAREPVPTAGTFALVRRDRYLLLIAGLVFFGAVVKTIGEYVLSDSAAQRALELVPATAHAELVGHARALAVIADREELIKQFYSSFFFWVNLASLVIQALFVARAIEVLGIGRGLFVMPLIAFGAYGAIAAFGGFALVRAAKIAENSTEYSLDSTVRQTLFLPTDRAAKYHAKAAIDTFAVRAGDTLSAIVIWLGVRRIGVHGRALAAVNVVLVIAWLAVVTALAHQHRRRGLVAAEARIGSAPHDEAA